MQSTLDRKVIYLMLRGARRQESERRQAAARRRKPAPAALPARLTGDGWWLDARVTAAPQLVTSNSVENFPAQLTAKVTADE